MYACKDVMTCIYITCKINEVLLDKETRHSAGHSYVQSSFSFIHPISCLSCFLFDLLVYEFILIIYVLTVQDWEISGILERKRTSSVDVYAIYSYTIHCSTQAKNIRFWFI
jgi:hypothetical protein